jgi:hypothetical protein
MIFSDIETSFHDEVCVCLFVEVVEEGQPKISRTRWHSAAPPLESKPPNG